MTVPRLNRKLALESPETTPDGAGGQIETWTVLGTLWAELRPRTGRERTGEAGAVSAGAYRVTVRAVPEGSSMRPRPGQRLRNGARVFRILAVTERDADGLYLICFAQEEVAV